jgi:hypothetical protein
VCSPLTVCRSNAGIIRSGSLFPHVAGPRHGNAGPTLR